MATKDLVTYGITKGGMATLDADFSHTEHIEISRKWALRLAWLSLTLVLAALAFYAVNGWYIRYLADDYETAAKLNEVGFWGSQGYWYTHWSGRFSFYLTVSLAELIGLPIIRVLPGLMIFTWLAAIAWSLLPALHKAGVRRLHFAAWFLAALLVYGILREIPALVQSLYWQTGVLTYLAPLAVISFLPGMILRLTKHNQKFAWGLAACALAAIFAAGFSETSAAFQTTLIGLAFFTALFYPKGSDWHRALPFIAAGLAGSLVGMALVAFAPGNAVRMANYQSCGIIEIARRTIVESWQYSLPGWRDLPQIALLVLLPTLLAVPFSNPLSKRKTAVWLLALPAAAFLVVTASILPSFYLICAGPPNRVFIVPQFVLSGTMIGWGWLAGAAFLKTRAVKRLWQVKLVRFTIVLITLILLAAGPVYAAYRSVLRGEGLRAYAAEWDARHEMILTARQAGQRRIAVPTVTLTLDKDLGDLRIEPDFWINQAAARYYGLDEIQAVGPSTLP